ncbi:MAG: hypothetical protein ACFFB2_03560 [Promethearchaeota archaeon]
MNISQFLLMITTQFVIQVAQLKKKWQKWIFFVLTSAIGEGFKIDSCRDYPREEFTGVNLEKFLVNEYDLIVNMLDEECSLRIDPNVKENFFTLIENHKSKILKQKITKYSLPLNNDYKKDRIRILDLTLIMKRSKLVTPTLKEVQSWILTWNPLKESEFSLLDKVLVNNGILDLSELPPFLNNEEILRKGWKDYLDTSLSQPRGLICPKCKITYKANIYAKTCNSCQTRLKKA